MPPYDLLPSNEENSQQGVITLNIDPSTDTYVIKGAGGVAVAHVKKPNGVVQSTRVQANGALRQFTEFNSNMLTVEERRQLEKDLYERDKLKQTEIADLLGVSQATVATDLKKLRE